MSSSSKILPQTRLLERAVRVLALRDHSEQELRGKLATLLSRTADEAPTVEDIDAVLTYCIQRHWLDDARFAERYVAGRGRKGYGPLRIRQELQGKGIERTLVDRALSASDIDWAVIAWEQAVRRFGQPLPAEYTEKAKLQRFLLYRGFSTEDIQTIYRNFSD